MKRIDRTGKRFGRLTVLGINPDKTIVGKIYWDCLCDCGKKAIVSAANLISVHTKSCGCFKREAENNPAWVHGQARRGKATPEYRMWKNSKKRAVECGLAFDLKVEDIDIPEYCPIFSSIKLNKENTKSCFDSPSLDRLIPSLGYVKGNVRVVSMRANVIKNDASWQELMIVANWVKSEVEKGARQ